MDLISNKYTVRKKKLVITFSARCDNCQNWESWKIFILISTNSYKTIISQSYKLFFSPFDSRKTKNGNVSSEDFNSAKLDILSQALEEKHKFLPISMWLPLSETKL